MFEGLEHSIPSANYIDDRLNTYYLYVYVFKGQERYANKQRT